MEAVITKLRRGERHWPAEIIFRTAGLTASWWCLFNWRWECRLASEAPHHEATALEFLVAALVFFSLVSAIALTFEGPGLLRHVPLPPRAMLP